MAHGRESFFTVSGSTVTPTSPEFGVLSKASTGWQFVSTENEQFAFDDAGKLIRWSNAYGAVHELTYASNQVTVTDNFGYSLTFTEDADHQPLTLSAPGVQVIYGYDANKNLISVTRTAGGATAQRKMLYEDSRNNRLLTGILDESGARLATWAYDSQGRAISSEHANGAEKVTLAYNADGSTTVTNQYGKKTTYRFQLIQGVRQIVAIEGASTPNCPNSNSTFTYDSRGLLKTKTDNKGNLTTYDYNDRGLEVSRTEAAGTLQARTITTQWHPTLFLKTQITEPGRVIRYQYDEQGRRTGQTVTPL
jgi:YD repeat-containing protein